MSNLASRLKQRRIELGYKSQRELSRISGTPFPTIQQLESGDRLQSKYLGKIAQTLKTTADYLLTGAISLPSFFASDQKNDPANLEPLKISQNAVPMVPIIDWNDVQIWNDLSVSLRTRKYEMVPLLGKSSANSYALKIKDESMISLLPNSDSFRQGDVLIIDPEKVSKVGSFVLAEIMEKTECIFRQLVELSGEKYLVALNPVYPREKVTDKVKILGVLSGTYRQHD
jgi:SOS-response transcriptional repressor LexA